MNEDNKRTTLFLFVCNRTVLWWQKKRGRSGLIIVHSIVFLSIYSFVQRSFTILFVLLFFSRMRSCCPAHCMRKILFTSTRLFSIYNKSKLAHPLVEREGKSHLPPSCAPQFVELINILRRSRLCQTSKTGRWEKDRLF